MLFNLYLRIGIVIKLCVLDDKTLNLLSLKQRYCSQELTKNVLCRRIDLVETS